MLRTLVLLSFLSSTAALAKNDNGNNGKGPSLPLSSAAEPLAAAALVAFAAKRLRKRG